MPVDVLAAVHLAATAFMVGLIWTIHVVHYPLFALVNEPFRPFQEAHMVRISRLLVLPWAVEVVTAVWLMVAAPGGWPQALALAGLGLIGAIVLVTGFGAAPIHGRLVERFDAELHHRLVRIDRVRTLLWTARLGTVLSFILIV